LTFVTKPEVAKIFVKLLEKGKVNGRRNGKNEENKVKNSYTAKIGRIVCGA